MPPAGSIDVSIVMPTYNTNPDWLRASVRSVLDDDGRIEVIVIDDGSEPPATEILHDIGDPRLRIERLDHVGQSNARNRGIELARGRFVRHFDADDVATPGSTSWLLELTNGRDDVATYGGYVECTDTLKPVETVLCSTDGDVAEAMMLDRGFSIYHWCMLMPRDVLLDIGGWDPNITHSVDFDLSLRVAERVPMISGDRIVAHYRRHDGSVSRKAALAGLTGVRQTCAKAYDRNPHWRSTHIEAGARLHLFADEIAWGHGAEAIGDVVTTIGRALRHDPVASVRQVAAVGPRIARATGYRVKQRFAGT